MHFMLDTDICINLIRDRSVKLLRRLKRRRPEDVCVSAITVSELEYGVAKSSAPEKNRLALAEFMIPIAVAPYDDNVAPHYGRIRAELEAQGMPIGPLDTMIAAHAVALGVVLVTSNKREFRRVPDLRIENWAK